MKESLIHMAETSLCKFLSYRRLVQLSCKLNVPIAPPLIASLPVTHRCNSKCLYCDIWKLGQDSRKKRIYSEMLKEVPLEDLKRLFHSLTRLGVRVVTFGGGEPLMRNDLEDIISSAKDMGLMVDICTNGILLTEERTIRLAEAGADTILLSIDTQDPELYQKHRGVPFNIAERALASLLHITESHPAIWASVNCVVTKYNIGTLAQFAEWISKCGEGRIALTFQPYHRASPLPKISELPLRLQEPVSTMLADWQEDLSEADLVPDPDLRPVFEKEIEELIQLKKINDRLPNNSEFFLRGMPDFLFGNNMPANFRCVAGYTGIVIRSNFNLILPCWRLPPVGDLETESLANIWFSRRYARKRKDMEHLNCPGCALVCHTEPGWFHWYNNIYKSRVQKVPRITK